MAAKRSKTASARSKRAPKPFTLEHFRRFASLMVFEDGEQREPEKWQLAFAKDVFAGYSECWLIVPEGNGKSTFLAQLALYGLHYSPEPWIPVGAASRDQAEIIYGQAAGFVRRTEELRPLFRCYDGYRKITSRKNGGRGLKVYPHDPKTGDGVIPAPYALVDEPHRHPDMRLYGLWKGKLRKRGAQILAISTAGEPGTPFEEMRDEIRRRAEDRKRNGAYLRAASEALVLHEYMVQSEEDCANMEAVKQANPLGEITVKQLRSEFESATMDLQEWKRFKCNRATRSVAVAVTDAEWDGAQVDDEIPEGAEVILGMDVAWKWDTTSIVPLWRGPKYRLLGDPAILVPPRDGSMMNPDVVKEALIDLGERYELRTVVMDTHRAEDTAAWVEDTLGLDVIDRGQGNQFKVADYEAFMEGLRNGTLKHTGDPGLRRHVLNAAARRLPGGDFRFDRPSSTRQNIRQQDTRVIDALDAAAMAVEYSNREAPPPRSVYEDRDLIAV
jgi:phage terminase large subunit-like protein